MTTHSKSKKPLNSKGWSSGFLNDFIDDFLLSGDSILPLSFGFDLILFALKNQNGIK